MEIDARLLAARREGEASFNSERGKWSGGGYSVGSGEHSAWESGRKQAHNMGFVPDRTKSMTSNWRASVPADAPVTEPVNPYALIRG